MRQIKSISALTKIITEIKRKGETIGFVPTMGALHEGHLSLLNRSRRENQHSILSIYVNPTQFDPKKEDFSSYPRDKKKDILLAKKQNVDIIFLPTDNTMYPQGFSSFISTRDLTDNLCGKSRPGHFKGVTTIVGKLLNIVQPNRMYLGQKDAQQAVIIQRMVTDLNYPVKIVVCPTVREKDGLAMSSRNAYLNARNRREAPVIYKSLRHARQLIQDGEERTHVILKEIRHFITAQTAAEIEYIECVDYNTLKPLRRLKGKILIAIAVKFAKARLIDNMVVHLR